MRRRLLTIHKAMKAAQAARVLALVAEEYGEDDVVLETTTDGLVVKADSNWNRKVDRG